MAEEKNDEVLLTRIRGYDLFASKACYHSSCRKAYLQNPEAWRSENFVEKKRQADLEEAHTFAFQQVCMELDKRVIEGKEILKLSDLLKVYIEALQTTNFPNSQYRGEKLKNKIKKTPTYSDNIGFCSLDEPGQYHSYLVYNSQTELEHAIRFSYRLGSLDTILEVAMHLRRTIFDAFKKSEEIPWPPTDDYLRQTDMLPEQLETFLSYLFSGKAGEQSAKVSRLVLSIGQDICRAVTNAEWKLPKHILICTTLRHLFRSKEMITLINRLGHSESYSFSLELETAIAVAVQETSELLSSQIVRNPQGPAIFHSEFDNYDQLINDLTGKGSIHTAHGIMMQEASEGTHPQLAITEKPASKKRSWTDAPNEPLPDCYVTQRKSPQMTVEGTSVEGSQAAFHLAQKKDIAWLFLRNKQSGNQTIPGWAGFVSSGRKPDHLTKIGYYPVIHQPITQYSTVQECLRYAEKATDEVGQNQKYVYSTYDLGVCMKAYPLLWKFPERFDRHVVLIGTFHLIMGYYKMLGKKMDGSGLSDVLLEANLISSGSLQGVLAGKHYDRATNCHKVVLESMHRLLMQEYLQTRSKAEVFNGLGNEKVKMVETVTNDLSPESLTWFLEDPDLLTDLDDYLDFCETVRNGQLGKTAKFWLTYMDHVSLVLSLMRAVKTNDFYLYAYCIEHMSDLFFAYGGQNYARYLTYFSAFIANLELSHPGVTEEIKLGVISVARSMIPGNRCAVDKTMEETFMKNAKSKGGAGGSGAGISGISRNPAAYQRWIRTTHERSKYVDATYSMADMLDNSHTAKEHRDLRPAEICRSEEAVSRTVEAVTNFINPFNVNETGRLYCISSGVPMPPEIENDVLRAELAGRNEKEDFVVTRLKKNDNFFDPVKKLKLKTMVDLSKKVKLKTQTSKVIEYKQQGNIAFQLLVTSQNLNINLDLKDVMSYQLTPVPYCIGSVDGFLAKTNKAKGFQFLTNGIEDANQPEPRNTLLIVDGNAVFHSLTEIPDNFRNICIKIFSLIPGKSDVLFSTDMYQENSIKAIERKRRGYGEKLLVKGGSTKKPSDWKEFLGNEDNKEQLVKVLLEVWSDHSFATHLKDRKVVFH